MSSGLCNNCGKSESIKTAMLNDKMLGRVDVFALCQECYDEAVRNNLVVHTDFQHGSARQNEKADDGWGQSKSMEESGMAGKQPTYRIVVGKRNCGVLWEAVSQKGLNYFSGQLDISAIKEAIKDGTGKTKMVTNRDGTEAEVMRVAMFKHVPKPKGEQGSKGWQQ